MKTRYIFTIGLLTFFMLYSCKKENAADLYTNEEKKSLASNISSPENAPILIINENMHDFGDVKPNESLEAYIKIQNKGKTPLIIRDVATSCGCTVTEYPNKPIAPNNFDSIKVVYTAGNNTGKQYKSVTLVTNTINGNERFDITANIVDHSKK